MFAVVQTGGKQIKVCCGDRFVAETIPHMKDAGQLEQVLSVCESSGKMHVGVPFVKGASVKVKKVQAVRSRKVLVFKKKRRNNYRRLKGHRQAGLLLQVVDVCLNGKSVSA